MAAKSGRPSSYRAEFAKQAEKLCKLGATDDDLADFFDVTITTIKNWKSRHPPFLAALKGGKEAADDRVERSLYQKAVGYTHDAVKIVTVAQGNNMGSVVESVPYREHVPPDTTACIFWLKNRRPDLWRDKVENKLSGDPLNPLEHRHEIIRRVIHDPKA